MWLGRSFYTGWVARLDAASGDNHAKHPALEFWYAFGPSHLAFQAFLKAVEQGAWCAKTCQFDDRRFAKVQPGSER